MGTGLGLSISRELVERVGGRIEVVSPPFQGAGGEWMLVTGAVLCGVIWLAVQRGY